MTYPDDYINKIINGDCKEVLKTLPENSVDAIVTDPPAGISFMGKEWDDDKGGREGWVKWLSEVMSEAKRVLKPGGHALVWALPRTSHWTGTALENAGFEVRDCVYHLFGSGFPKSLDISKAIDKQNGVEHPKNTLISENSAMSGGNYTRHTMDVQSEQAKQWEGWGTALKPAVECWWLCRKPLEEDTVAENVLKWGTGGLNIDGTRIQTEDNLNGGAYSKGDFTKTEIFKMPKMPGEYQQPIGRFPANLTHDGSDVILAEFAKTETSKGGKPVNVNAEKSMLGIGTNSTYYGNDGDSPARFFYTAKPSSSEKNLLYGDFEEKQKVFNGQSDEPSKNMKGVEEKFTTAPAKNFHPTVKSQSLMSYLIKLITPPKGIVLDMFAGSGSTLLAAQNMGHLFIGIEIDPEYVAIAEGRLKQGVLNF